MNFVSTERVLGDVEVVWKELKVWATRKIFETTLAIYETTRRIFDTIRKSLGNDSKNIEDP